MMRCHLFNIMVLHQKEISSMAKMFYMSQICPTHPINHLHRFVKNFLQNVEKRIRPLRDDKILTSWNGLMIGAMGRSRGYFE